MGRGKREARWCKAPRFPLPASAFTNALGLAGFLLLSEACGGGAPYGTVQFGRITTDGVVDQDYLKQQLAPLEPRFQACYARTLRRNRSSEGIVHLAVQGGTGRLAARSVENTTGDSGLADCVTGAIGELPLVEREGTGPWAFTADWTVEFRIARLAPRRP